MNPLSPLTTALVAGATNAANPVVAPAYEALKALISRQLAGLPTADEAELALALFERKPDDENRQQMLQSILEAAGLHQRPELIASAQQLLVLINVNRSMQNTTTVNTGGGTYVEHDVNTGGGDFVGRDKTTNHNYGTTNIVNADNISAGNLVVGTQINQTAPKNEITPRVFDPTWFTPKPYNLLSPRDYATGVLVVNASNATYMTAGLTLTLAQVLHAELVKFGGDIAAAWVKVDYLDATLQTHIAYFAEGGKGGLTTLLGGSGNILVALQACISAKRE